MTTESHMRRLMDRIDQARERAAEAERLQAGAVTQLDTVDYELAAIASELAAAGLIAKRPVAEAESKVAPESEAVPPVRRTA
ncbi:MAG TPA: hypothetical protein PK264_14365 [Hyphomicrobiaceae bacterium]|nr:hypothetical protein [Hyphomicrobiaceae bacterium]